MNEKKKIYWDNGITLVCLIGGGLIAYVIGVVVFLEKGNEKTVGAFEAISSVTGVILSVCTIFYVVRAYLQQKRQNEIQTEQIKIQKEEIENNRKDAEFNRALDTVYKQLEYSKNIFLVNVQNIEKVRDLTYTTKFIECNISLFLIVFVKLEYELGLIKRLLDRSNLEKKDKEYFYKIFTSNIPYDYKIVIGKVIRCLKQIKNTDSEFRQILEEKYRDIIYNSSENRIQYCMSKEEITLDFIYYLHKGEFDVRLLDLNSLVRSSQYIDNFFLDNNIWLNDEIK